jgi:hypothetical protein
MTVAKAQRFLLERLGAGTASLLAVLLDLPTPAPWADGVDAEGRSVLLVGRHALGERDEAQQAISAVLDSLKAGEVPADVHAVAFAPKASALIAEVVAGESREVLGDGPRGTGKTQAVPAALAILAELHVRAGYAPPLRALWLHDTLRNASVKTGRSLELPLWSGLWSLRDDRSVAVFTLGGVEMVIADFVGTRDDSAGERSRAECHVVAGEELVPSLDETGGIEERRYELALTSMRLETRRRVAVSTTNPGDTDTWPYRRWIEGSGRPGCVRCDVPASDRLTREEVAALRAAFRDSPDLEQRLALGEWAALKLGEVVAEGYDPEVHIVPARLLPSQGLVLAIGWDGGHSPSAVIGQLVGRQVQIFAALNDLKIGVLELIEDQVIPWLTIWAPWTRKSGSGLIHVIDPSMATAGQATIRESAERTIRDTLKGRIVHGPIPWSPRREAVLRVLAPRHEEGQAPLAISGVPETRILCQALANRWYYPRTPDGRVDRSRPKKPNSPYADVGDAFAYLCGWLQPPRLRSDDRAPRPPTVKGSLHYADRKEANYAR